MFAVFKTGSVQYKACENDELKVEKIEGDAGAEIKFNQVLVLGKDKKTCVVGTPFVKGAVIKAEILSNARDSKILVFKKKRRKNYRRKMGHRQSVTYIRIKEIIVE